MGQSIMARRYLAKLAAKRLEERLQAGLKLQGECHVLIQAAERV